LFILYKKKTKGEKVMNIKEMEMKYEALIEKAESQHQYGSKEKERQILLEAMVLAIALEKEYNNMANGTNQEYVFHIYIEKATDWNMRVQQLHKDINEII